MQKKKKNPLDMSYLSIYKDGRVRLRLYVQPGAAKNKFAGLHGDAVKLLVRTAPIEGKANKAVIAFLAYFLQLKKKDIAIKHGLQSRLKTVLIAGLELDEIQEQLERTFHK